MSERTVIQRNDYTKPDYIISKTDLHFDIQPEYVDVSATLEIVKNSDVLKAPLMLNGQNLELLAIKIAGEALDPSEYTVADETLTIHNVEESFVLETVVRIDPYNNKALEGLYKSDDIICTQCEAEGFRRITYYIDRPDNMSIFTVSIESDHKTFPFLLSNGNKVAAESRPHGRHFVKWHDPFLKPAYLFALVAGDLAEVTDTFKTMTGRTVDIRFYVDKGNEPKSEYAIESLKNSMKWDEDTFGLECDLDTYMVVAVDAFNFGAMENKGLNIFNSKYVLADPKSATDTDYDNIEGVIGHEYFHNWTGNRVTCRDWFQLTLKEGLTVFRDQEFSSDMTSRPVKRISDVMTLRETQFTEDSGPMSHPIRPDSYIEIDNFYTSTVYNKGAEVIRMIESILGVETFRKGITKYFDLYDGQAVTTDDFIYSMEQVSGRDLTQFKNWYCQRGTPTCTVTSHYNDDTKEYSLNVKQSCVVQSSGMPSQPFHLPLRFGLLDTDGKEMSVTVPNSEQTTTSPILEITKKEETFVIRGIDSKPIPSLFRNFSAPIKVNYEYSDHELIFLIAHDSNEFTRYDAAQKLVLNMINATPVDSDTVYISDECFQAFGNLLAQNSSIDKAFAAQLLTPPSLNAIVGTWELCDYERASILRTSYVSQFAKKFEQELLDCYDRNKAEAYSNSSTERAKRSLKNSCLWYLSKLNDTHSSLIHDQFKESDNMTDSLASLSLLCNIPGKEQQEALSSFYDMWKDDQLVINKWFTVQASAQAETSYDAILKLERDQAYNAQNPNKVRSLIGAFSRNYVNFHHKSGRGYELIKNRIIEIDRFNPSMAARLAGSFEKYAVIPQELKEIMKKQLELILETEGISSGVYEVISKTLDNQ